jgi:hypothetical protein
MTWRLSRSEESHVVEATEAEAQEAVRDAVRRSGVSADELLRQGRAGRFETLRARLAWVAVGDRLADYVKTHPHSA